MKATGLRKDDLLPHMTKTSVDITQPLMITAVTEDDTMACSLPSYGYHNRYHWVAGHTEDTDNYPYTSYIYDHPDMVYRLIHIERIDGLVNVYLPIVFSNEGGSLFSVIRFTSSKAELIASSAAGLKWRVLIKGKGGVPCGVLHLSVSGLIINNEFLQNAG